MDITEIANQEIQNMTKTERKVAAYFYDHLQEFAFSTLDCIADDAGTSTTSVIRFCRRLGFAGYKEFQSALRQQIKVHLNLPDKLESTLQGAHGDSLLNQVVQDGIQVVERTFAELPSEALERAVECICSADRLFIFGMRESLALAHYAYTRMETARGRTYILDVGYNGMVEQALDLTEKDAVLYFLFHRYAAQSYRLLPFIKRQGVQVILVTSPPYSAVEKYADILLPCYMETRGVKNSSLAPMCLTDYFCNAVALRNSERTMLRLKKIEQALQDVSLLGSS